jgi:hypothetical protein
MKRTPSQDARRQALAGVNQTIANALSLLLVRPMLMVVPIVLDLLLWLAWQISPKPITNWLSQLMIDNGGNDGPAAAKEILAIGERARVNDFLATMTPSLFGGIPKDSILAVLLAVVAPGLSGGVDRSHMYRNWDQGLLTMWTPPNGFSVFTLALILIGFSTIFAVVFRVPQARAIREEAMTVRGLLKDMLDCWWKLAILIAILIVVGLVVVLPVFLVFGILYLVGINLVALLVLGLFVFGGMIAMYTFFTIDAIVLNRAGPLQALSLSFAVVRENFGPTCRFVLVSLLIGTGVLRVWDVLIENPPGIAIALVGNAFLGTGLSLASMLFFQDRLRLLDPKVIRRSRTIGRRWFR